MILISTPTVLFLEDAATAYARVTLPVHRSRFRRPRSKKKAPQPLEGGYGACRGVEQISGGQFL